MNLNLLNSKKLSKEQEKILQNENIKICALGDPAYPPLLGQISKPPEVLYYKGALPNPDDFAFAVVGTRKNTVYAERALNLILPDLIRAGAIIISGLALGIDTLAHKAALSANAKTFAILGGGVDKLTLYPKNNYSLADKIIATGGGVISEYPPLFTPTKYTFPARNRIIAGLARSVLVIEAPKGSGALITAYSALDEGRDVFAIPGDITRLESVGCNELIKRGAKPVLAAKDILEEYGLEVTQMEKISVELDSQEDNIVSILTNDPMDIDKIAKSANIPVSTTSGVLALLELKGVIKNIGGMRFVRL